VLHQFNAEPNIHTLRLHTKYGRQTSARRYVRTMHLPGKVPPALLVIVPGPGVIVAHSHADLALHAYTVNGRHLVWASQG